MGASTIVSDPAVHEGRLTIAGTGIDTADVLHLIAGGYSLKQVTEAIPGLSAKNVTDAVRYAAALLEAVDPQRDSALVAAASLALAEQDFDQQPPRPAEGRGTPWEAIVGFFGLMRGK
jgi:uncharacterized protein (DUF433 family)